MVEVLRVRLPDCYGMQISRVLHRRRGLAHRGALGDLRKSRLRLLSSFSPSRYSPGIFNL